MTGKILKFGFVWLFRCCLSLALILFSFYSLEEKKKNKDPAMIQCD